MEKFSSIGTVVKSGDFLLCHYLLLKTANTQVEDEKQEEISLPYHKSCDFKIPLAFKGILL